MRTRPDRLSQVTLGDGTQVTVDEYGYLVDPDAWSPAFAEQVARAEGLTLGARHWQVIDFIRAWHDAHGVAPDARHAMALLGAGSRTRGRHAFFELFPDGHVKQACKIAGMRQPRAWSTG